jgi:multicomponent Na+:H+ antiporter subunit B
MQNNILAYYLTKYLIICAIPLLILIQFSGTNSVGGGFQAGCIAATIVIVVVTTNIFNTKLKKTPLASKLIIFNAIGVLIYYLCGVISLILQENFIDYSAINYILQIFNLNCIGEKIGILLAEIGVLVTVNSSLSVIYLNME